MKKRSSGRLLAIVFPFWIKDALALNIDSTCRWNDKQQVHVDDMQQVPVERQGRSSPYRSVTL
jgi:hypothetical protein